MWTLLDLGERDDALGVRRSGDSLIVFGEYDGIFGAEGNNETVNVCFSGFIPCSTRDGELS